MMIPHHKKLILVNYEISKRNHDLNWGIYLTASKVAQYRLMVDNRRKRKRQRNKQKIIQPPKICIFNKSDVKVFRNYWTP